MTKQSFDGLVGGGSSLPEDDFGVVGTRESFVGKRSEGKHGRLVMKSVKTVAGGQVPFTRRVGSTEPLAKRSSPICSSA